MPKLLRAFAASIVALLVLFALLVLPPLYFTVFTSRPPDLPGAGRRVEVSPGRSVNVIEKGAGFPVVLVHGHPACAYDWLPLMDELAERGFRAIAYDRMGYGYSDGREPGPVTVDMNAQELLALIAALDLNDATLVGWSYGGGVSIVAMKQDRSRVARLLLLASIGPGIENREDVPKVPDWLVNFIAGPVYSWVSSVPPLSNRLSEFLQGNAFDPDPVPDWYALQTQANFGRPHTRDAFRSEGRDLGGQADLDPSAIDLPILIIHGSEDKLAPAFVAETNHLRAPHSQLRMIPRGGHMLPITHAPLVADAIRDFASTERTLSFLW
jgi:non-heme chloroperoxidase